MRSLIELNPDLAETTRQLRRIADCFETYLWLTHGYRMSVPDPPSSGPINDTDIAYSSDTETLKRELMDIERHRDPLRPIEADEEEERMR